MAFSSSTTAALTQQKIERRFQLLVRTAFPESQAFAEVPIEGDFELQLDSENFASELIVRPVNFNYSMSDESNPSNRLQLLSEVEFWCYVILTSLGLAGVEGTDYERDRLFKGFIHEVRPRGLDFEIVCFDRLQIAARSACSIHVEADVTSTSEASYQGRQIVPTVIGGITYHSPVWAGPGSNDPAFSPDGKRRAFRAGAIRVKKYTPAEFLPPDDYVILDGSGLVKIKDPVLSQGNLLLVGAKWIIEGSSSNGYKGSLEKTVEAALIYPKSEGGPGFQPSELDLQPSGITLSQITFDQSNGSVTDLLKQLLQTFSTGAYRIRYDSSSDRIIGRIVTQSSSPDLELLNPQLVGVPRDTEETYARVMVPATLEKGDNLAALQGATLTDLLQGGEVISTRANLNFLTDGDLKTMYQHNMTTGGWEYRDFIKIDLGSVKPVDAVRIMVGDRKNPNGGDYGLSALGSDTDVDSAYVPISPVAGEIYNVDGGREVKPLEFLNLEELTLNRFRFFKIRMKPVKWNAGNQARAFCLAEVRVIGPERIFGKGTLTNDPNDPERYYNFADGTSFDRYRPYLLTKSSLYGSPTYVDSIDPKAIVGEAAATERAYLLLRELVNTFERVSYRSAFDPRASLHQTVKVKDLMNIPSSRTVGGDPNSMNILVERLRLSGEDTEIEGTDYRGANS